MPLPGLSVISIHTSREGGDTASSRRVSSKAGFQSTPPAREVTSLLRNAFVTAAFQSTPPAREVTLGTDAQIMKIGFQSTPPAREVTIDEMHLEFNSLISIHTSREGGDHPWHRVILGFHTFQSTPPAREVTIVLFPFLLVPRISIHTSREGGDAINNFMTGGFYYISIHTSREGGDVAVPLTTSIIAVFQSTPPAREVTAVRNPVPYSGDISIHTSREGGD